MTFGALVAGVALLLASVAVGVRDRDQQRSIRDQALATTARDEADLLVEYFARARALILITAQNPAFRDFYAARGSRVAKLKARTAAIREAERALAYLETLYPASIGEASFVDRGGGENARYVNGRLASFPELESDERAAPFFEPTFALRAGEVYQPRPYVSDDARQWVVSNSTPVPGGGFPAAAIVHFEITVESIRRMTAASAGDDDDVAIVDARTGRIVVESGRVQQKDAGLGRPFDLQFRALVSTGAASGFTSVAGHRVAYTRLEKTDHNENDWYVVAIDRTTDGLLDSAGWAPPGMAVAALALLGLGGVSARSTRRGSREDARARAREAERADEERRYYETQHEFTEVMQITRDETEAYELLRRHLMRSLPGSCVVVLNRNSSQNRLEAMTELPEGSPLIDRLGAAAPDTCLAVRLAKTHEHGVDREPLLRCELCGDQSATCVPSLVGGEVIGAVLVRHDEPLAGEAKRRVEASITQAAPVLANLRSLALSQARALTDGLTGLPNRRAVDEALKRMTALADRTSTPLAAVLFDLDHFKRINDLSGHEKGDEALAAVGATVSTTVRASELVGRYGGEEFIVLLPDTDRAGAAIVAEKLRVAIAQIDVPGISQPITASFGVAALPEDATEPALLVRAADRALYLAKAQGRNRVATVAFEDAEPTPPDTETPAPRGDGQPQIA